MGYPYEEGGQAVMERGGQSAMQASVTTIARQPSAEQVLVSACGRTCSVEMQNARSVVDLQASLQRTLQMEGQAFSHLRHQRVSPLNGHAGSRCHSTGPYATLRYPPRQVSASLGEPARGARSDAVEACT